MKGLLINELYYSKISIDKQTDRQTDRQTDKLSTVPSTHMGEGNILYMYPTIKERPMALQCLFLLVHTTDLQTPTCTITVLMKHTKVLGTLARTYANEYMCIFN